MRFGVVVGGPAAGGVSDVLSTAGALSKLGFESFEIEFWQDLGGVDLARLAEGFAAIRADGGTVSSLGVYGNTLAPDGRTLGALRALLEAAGSFGSTLVSCFAGRVPGSSVPDSLEAWKAAFGELAERAAARGLTIALENCRLGDTWKIGKWNIAINPDAWELLFDALPGAPIGLEWEPSHQILALADPQAQLAEWADRVVHVHGKDALIRREELAVKGYFAAGKIGRECLPGEGEGNWTEILRILARSGYDGSVDLELPARADGGRGGNDAGSRVEVGARVDIASESAADRERLVASLSYLRRAATRATPPFESGTRLA